MRKRDTAAHRAVLVLPPPRDDFDAFLQASQRRVVHRLAHMVTVMKQRWGREYQNAPLVTIVRGNVSGHAGRGGPSDEED